MWVLPIYFTGLILAFIIYDVIIYEKYNGQFFSKYNKKDFIHGLLILTSWLYVTGFVLYEMYDLKKDGYYYKNIN